jgi:hypothetical protein
MRHASDRATEAPHDFSLLPPRSQGPERRSIFALKVAAFSKAFGLPDVWNPDRLPAAYFARATPIIAQDRAKTAKPSKPCGSNPGIAWLAIARNYSDITAQIMSDLRRCIATLVGRRSIHHGIQGAEFNHVRPIGSAHAREIFVVALRPFEGNRHGDQATQ